MPNASTFYSFNQFYPTTHPFSLPVAFTTTTSSETQFLLSNGQPAVVAIPTGTAILGSAAPFTGGNNTIAAESVMPGGNWMGENRPFFSSSSFDNRPFRLRAFGYISGGLTTLTLVSASINIYAGLTQASTVTSGTEIANLSITGGIGGAKANWAIDCLLQWDSKSQQLNGTRSGFVGNLITSGSTVLSTAITPVASLSLTSLNFGLTWVFATTSTSNVIGLTELSLERV